MHSSRNRRFVPALLSCLALFLGLAATIVPAESASAKTLYQPKPSTSPSYSSFFDCERAREDMASIHRTKKCKSYPSTTGTIASWRFIYYVS